MEEKRNKKQIGAVVFWAMAALLFLIFGVWGTMGLHAAEKDGIVTSQSGGVVDESLVSGKQLVYGNEELADEDAFVLVMYGDGFTSGEQDKFYEAASGMSTYLMETSPWDEVADAVKIYAVGCISAQSGIKGDTSDSYYAAYYDTRDTYFNTMFWYYGTERLVYFSDEDTGEARVEALTEKYVPAADYEIIVANSEKYGGSGGDVCFASLNGDSMEILIHELGHTIADLADEYYAGDYYAGEYANMTRESDPEKVGWARFVGKNGVGVYEYTSGGDGWYRPSTSCKMQYLGKSHPFCEVCKEELRKAFCQNSNVTELFFQTYADEFYASDTAVDMKQYFIVRRGDNETTGDTLGDALTLTYYDASGTPLEAAPSVAGNYTVKAEFAGNDMYGACTRTGTYTIEPAKATIKCPAKVYDGTPAEVEIIYDEQNYDISVSYSGNEYTYTADSYNSQEAPVLPGKYTVSVQLKKDGEPVMEKTADFEIRFKKTAITNHNDDAYAGASSYYNNKMIAITGEGFKAEEQEKFEALAQKYVSYLRSYEPLKECDIYFNYSAIEAVSKESGIGETPSENSYFGLYCDADGQIQEDVSGTKNNSYCKANYLAYTGISYDYQSVIVIVNDADVKSGLSNNGMIYAGADEGGMEYAARELVNYLTGKEAGYVPGTDEEKEELREALIGEVCYSYSSYDYPVIVSSAYDETFVEDGTAYDLAPYFHTYINSTYYGFMELDLSDAYVLTYYADEDGEPGQKLDGAPSDAGTYHVCAELYSNYGTEDYSWCYGTTTPDGNDLYLMVPARGWTTYTIVAETKEEPATENVPSAVGEKEDTEAGALTKEQIAEAVKKIEDAKAGSEVTVEMGSATIVSDEILAAAKENDVILVLQMDGYRWKINGATIETTIDVNLSLKCGTKNIPGELVEKVAQGCSFMQLSLDKYDGAFGFEAELLLTVNPEHAGKQGILYYYNEKTGKLEKQCSGMVSNTGEISLIFTHASDYVLVFEEAAPGTNEVVSAASETKTEDSVNQDASVQTASPDTSDVNTPAVGCLIFFSGLLCLAFAAGRKNKSV